LVDGFGGGPQTARKTLLVLGPGFGPRFWGPPPEKRKTEIRLRGIPRCDFWKSSFSIPRGLEPNPFEPDSKPERVLIYSLAHARFVGEIFMQCGPRRIFESDFRERVSGNSFAMGPPRGPNTIVPERVSPAIAHLVMVVHRLFFAAMGFLSLLDLQRFVKLSVWWM
jgi:hypothetical protein